MSKSSEAFRTIREVADWLGVAAHVLRFWESKFPQIKPVKRAGGRRYYRPADMELVGGIKVLLHDRGMTIRGVQKMIREDGVASVAALSPPVLPGAQGAEDAEAVADGSIEAWINDAAAEDTVEIAAVAAPDPDSDAGRPMAVAGATAPTVPQAQLRFDLPGDGARTAAALELPGHPASADDRDGDDGQSMPRDVEGRGDATGTGGASATGQDAPDAGPVVAAAQEGEPPAQAAPRSVKEPVRGVPPASTAQPADTDPRGERASAKAEPTAPDPETSAPYADRKAAGTDAAAGPPALATLAARMAAASAPARAGVRPALVRLRDRMRAEP